MIPSSVFLTAPRYVLGEIEEDHTAIVGLPERIAELRILPKADFWGWGEIRRTEKDIAAMAVESGAATLRAAAVDPASIDALVLCSTEFPEGTGSHGLLVQTVMSGLGLEGVDFIGVTLNSCANLLAGIQVADAMVASGRYRRVLVVTSDRVADESARMEKFALFSDGAASCVVAADQGGFELVSCAAAHNIQDLDWSSEISSELSRKVNERLMKSAGMKLEDVSGLMHANIFKPILVLKEMQAGFAADQLYTDNIARTGHCFAADPLINLVDRTAAGHVRDGCCYLLASSVPGSRIGVLLRKVPEQP
ncbi:MAG: 3-oxoacyl-ACP synthase [Micromonosporaceae bacterium]|nr:3-oxoacyl-ACP synthase [Micromonosporaceae bacterium]